MPMAIPAQTDILVVGAGVMGASIAYHLSVAAPEKSVLVIDQHGPLGGMSGRTFGQVRLHYSNALTLEMARFGIDYVRHWDVEVGLGSSGYVPMGYLLIVAPADLEAVEHNVALAQSLGIKTRALKPDQIGEYEPAIRTEGLAGGVWEPSGGYIDITRMTLGWLEAARQRGRVTVCSGICATGLEKTNGAITGVETDAGLIKAESVVLATGPWSKPLLADIGLDVPLDAIPIETMYMKNPDGATPIRTCVTDCQSNIVVRPDMGQTMLVAAYPGKMEAVDDPLVQSNQQSEAEHLARINVAFAKRFPDLRGATPIRSVAGTYDVTPDWHPVLGPAPEVDGLHLAMGFSGHGLKLSPAVGRVIADQILEQDPIFDVSPLRLSRFAENDLMFLAYGPGGRA